MRSFDENGGSKLLYHWTEKPRPVIQLHLDLSSIGIELRMDGTIVGFPTSNLHIVGPAHVGSPGSDCEASIDFEEESLEVLPNGALKIPLKNGDTIFLSENREHIPKL